MDALAEIVKDEAIREQYGKLPPHMREAFAWRSGWLLKAHQHQIVPSGDWWSIWLLLAGRGAGKTRTAAEQIAWWAWTMPETRWLVSAPTSSDVRGTCFEGKSGLINVIPECLVADYNRSYHEIKLINGSLIKGVPASEPERFRGGQYHGAWCCLPGTMIELPNNERKPIESIEAGAFVMTRHGPRKVLVSCASKNPNDLVYIECGETSLTVTSDHPILIGDQWIPAGSIKSGDLVWATNALAAGTLTDLPMSKPTDRYPRAGSFITRMKTRATTILQTLRQCLEVSIKGSTPAIGQHQPINRPQPLIPLLDCERLSLLSAFSARLDLFRCLQTRLVDSVRGHVSKHGEIKDSLQSSGIALSVKVHTLPSDPSNDTAASNATPSPQPEPIALRQLAVQSVERLPNSQTYSLTVEGEHEFIANGIVVHNCDELAAWEYLDEAWSQIQFSVRLGTKTKIICTTTPRPKDIIVELVGRDGDDVKLTTASTYTNIDNLADNFRKQILQYEGTNLGRQEIYAELIDPEESGIVKRNMFKLWPADKPFPKFEYIIQSYDCAYTEKTHNDPTACIVFGMFKPLDGPMAAMVIDAWQDRLQYPDLRPKMIEEFKTSYGADPDKDSRHYTSGKMPDLVLIENKASGISLIQDLQRAHLPVQAYNPGRADKIQRLSIVANIIAAKRVWIPESSHKKGYVRDWAEGFVSQICSFPDSTHDDYVDACTQALRYLRDSGWLDIDPDRQYDDDDYADARPKRVNPYSV